MDDDGNLFLTASGIELIKTYEGHPADDLQELFETEGVRGVAERWLTESSAARCACCCR